MIDEKDAENIRSWGVKPSLDMPPPDVDPSQKNKRKKVCALKKQMITVAV